MKSVFLFFALLIPWFLSGVLFPADLDFYYSLHLPSFAPPAILFIIMWSIIYVLLAISIFLVVTHFSKSSLKDYYKILGVYYISTQLFLLLFFTLRSPFWGFVDTVVVLLSSIFFYYETKSLSSLASKLLIVPVYWNLFALILSITIYFMNLSF